MLALEPMLPPLTTDADGVLRVTGTRVTLGSVAIAFDRGATAEEIVHRYPYDDHRLVLRALTNSPPVPVEDAP